MNPLSCFTFCSTHSSFGSFFRFLLLFLFPFTSPLCHLPLVAMVCYFSHTCLIPIAIAIPILIPILLMLILFACSSFPSFPFHLAPLSVTLTVYCLQSLLFHLNDRTSDAISCVSVSLCLSCRVLLLLRCKFITKRNTCTKCIFETALILFCLSLITWPISFVAFAKYNLPFVTWRGVICLTEGLSNAINSQVNGNCILSNGFTIFSNG